MKIVNTIILFTLTQVGPSEHICFFKSDYESSI